MLHILENIDRRGNQLDTAKEIVNFYNTYNNFPKNSSCDSVEKSLAKKKKLSHLREAYKSPEKHIN